MKLKHLNTKYIFPLLKFLRFPYYNELTENTYIDAFSIGKFLFCKKLFNNDEDFGLTELFKEIIKSGFEIESYDDHNVTIVLNNYKVNMWNANKYYAWAQKGQVVKDDVVVFSWSEARPSKSVLYDFIKIYEEKLKIYNINKIKQILPL